MEMMVDMAAMPGLKEKLCALLQQRAEEDDLFAQSALSKRCTKKVSVCIIA